MNCIKLSDISKTVKIELKDITSDGIGYVNHYKGKIYLNGKSLGNFSQTARNKEELIDKIIKYEITRR